MSDTTPRQRGERRLFDTGFFLMAALAGLAGALVWTQQGWLAFRDILLADVGFAIALLPKIAGGIVLATALGILLPRERVLRAVGPDSGVTGLGIAMVAGAVIPGGPSVIYPLAVSLMASGADIGAAVAMISAWVLLSVNRTVIWELSFIPADLVLLRVLLTLPLPIILGLLVRTSIRTLRITP